MFKKITLATENYEFFLDIFQNRYREIVSTKFREKYEVDKTPFELYESKGIHKIIIHDDLEAFSTNGRNILSIFRKFDDSTGFYEYNLSDLKYIDHTDFSNSTQLVELVAKHVIGDAKLIWKISFDDSTIDWLSKDSKGLDDIIISLVRDELSQYDRVMSSENGEYFEDVRYQFTRIDLSNVTKVLSTKQFTTIMDQAIFCYINNAYLASAATLGVALEEVCFEIIQKYLGPDFAIGSNTSLIELTGIMRTNGIIDRRVARRIQAASMLRNVASHSNTGYIAQTDCDILIQTIVMLVGAYLGNTITLRAIGSEVK